MKRDTSPGAPASGSLLSTPVSRRAFLHAVGATAAATAALGPVATAAAADTPPAKATPSAGTVAVTVSINGERRAFSVEPRVTLLELIREHAGLTGPKEVCEHATCGACTVLLDGVPVYACMMLAVEADGRGPHGRGTFPRRPYSPPAGDRRKRRTSCFTYRTFCHSRPRLHGHSGRSRKSGFHKSFQY
jgi:hypothetical protein